MSIIFEENDEISFHLKQLLQEALDKGEKDLYGYIAARTYFPGKSVAVWLENQGLPGDVQKR